jgi:hypothetical protein
VIGHGPCYTAAGVRSSASPCCGSVEVATVATGVSSRRPNRLCNHCSKRDPTPFQRCRRDHDKSRDWFTSMGIEVVAIQLEPAS